MLIVSSHASPADSDLYLARAKALLQAARKRLAYAAAHGLFLIKCSRDGSGIVALIIRVMDEMCAKSGARHLRQRHRSTPS